MGMMFHRYFERSKVKDVDTKKTVPVQPTIKEEKVEPVPEKVETPKKEYKKPYQRGRNKRKS